MKKTKWQKPLVLSVASMMAVISPMTVGADDAKYGNDKDKPLICTWKDEAKLRTHLRSHVTYPATGQQIEEACNKQMPDEFSLKEKACLEAKLDDDKLYRSADEVLRDLDLK